jgi:two-component system chemotaxis response regulator CheY
VVTRVLVVDDSAAVRDICAQMLSNRGFEVVTAEGGVSAVAVYEATQPDAVLLDVQMPEMDGLSTLQALRALDPTVRVAMLTANADGEAVRRALALGALDYVLKPFRARRLAEAVDRLLASG